MFGGWEVQPSRERWGALPWQILEPCLVDPSGFFCNFWASRRSSCQGLQHLCLVYHNLFSSSSPWTVDDFNFWLEDRDWWPPCSFSRVVVLNLQRQVTSRCHGKKGDDDFCQSADFLWNRRASPPAGSGNRNAAKSLLENWFFFPPSSPPEDRSEGFDPRALNWICKLNINYAMCNSLRSCHCSFGLYYGTLFMINNHGCMHEFTLK